jgi:hypothetical protein
MGTSTTFEALRINNAEQLKESVNEALSSNIYFTFGRVLPWATPYNDFTVPKPANSSISTTYEVWNHMVGGKRINGSDIAHVIPRYSWTYGETYTGYSHLSTNLFDDNVKFYIINRNNDVYKCLSNNYGKISTVEPTSINPTVDTITSDGYVWKYMYTLSDNEIIRFCTDDYITVKTLKTNDGSTQWAVQSAAIDGGISHIEITNPGHYYTNSQNITLTVTGDGSGFSGVALMSNATNTINTVIVTNPGFGYTYANVTIGGGGTRPTKSNVANARAIISPPGGHGSNPLYELGGKNLMFNIKLRYDEDGTFPPTNDFRQVAIIKDPKDLSANTLSTPAFLQAKVLTLFGSGDYLDDEIVYQGPSLVRSTFSGEVMHWDYVNNRIYLVNTKGTPTGAKLQGTVLFSSRQVIDIENGLCTPYSGQILYVDNMTPVSRAPDQIEDFKILVKF